MLIPLNAEFSWVLLKFKKMVILALSLSSEIFARILFLRMTFATIKFGTMT